MKKTALCLAPLVFFILVPVLLSAQDNMGMSGGKQTMSVTGCLKQGTDAGGYYVMGQDGKMYELMGKGLGAHVGHTVTVTGMQVTLPHAQEEKKEASERRRRHRFVRRHEGKRRKDGEYELSIDQGIAVELNNQRAQLLAELCSRRLCGGDSEDGTAAGSTMEAGWKTFSEVPEPWRD